MTRGCAMTLVPDTESAEELAMVKGIGRSTVEQNRDRIELRTGAAPARKPAAATAAPAKPVARR